MKKDPPRPKPKRVFIPAHVSLSVVSPFGPVDPGWRGVRT